MSEIKEKNIEEYKKSYRMIILFASFLIVVLLFNTYTKYEYYYAINFLFILSIASFLAVYIVEVNKMPHFSDKVSQMKLIIALPIGYLIAVFLDFANSFNRSFDNFFTHSNEPEPPILICDLFAIIILLIIIFTSIANLRMLSKVEQIVDKTDLSIDVNAASIAIISNDLKNKIEEKNCETNDSSEKQNDITKINDKKNKYGIVIVSIIIAVISPLLLVYIISPIFLLSYPIAIGVVLFTSVSIEGMPIFSNEKSLKKHISAWLFLLAMWFIFVLAQYDIRYLFADFPFDVSFVGTVIFRLLNIFIASWIIVICLKNIKILTKFVSENINS